ncbi:MAG TPA: heavy metal-binding domain-containing protein [Candidatus Hydrogenedentes bacterium]|nr:heavy metal-binding domain-containing protein [Candidatus Hydrogenedentota bacterium]
MDTLINLFVFLVLLSLGFFIGRRNEARHYASIRKREGQLAALPVIAADDWDKSRPVREAWLETACVVISIDYFKRIALALRNIFGGRVLSIEPLLDRARREALLRLKESAAARNADLLVNLRMETSSIYGNKGKKASVGSVELFA